ncbi:MAG: class I SAM-dependent methyltransferase [Acidobacteria bacterium]|nr:class I SAM-dependent methyltransferase [Acidobacteriota bacterium]
MLNQTPSRITTLAWERALRSEFLADTTPDESVDRFAQILLALGKSTVLDVGCGNGRHSLLLAQKGFDTYALDMTESSLQLTQALLKQHQLRATMTKAYMEELPFPDETFDGLLGFCVYNHGDGPQVHASIVESQRVLCRGGFMYLCLMTPRDFRYQLGKRAKPRMLIFDRGPERGIPHYFISRLQLETLFRNFSIVDFRLEEEEANELVLRDYLCGAGQGTRLISHYTLIATKN